MKKVAHPSVQVRAPQPVCEFAQEAYRPVAQAPAPVYAPQPVANAICLDCGEVATVTAIEQKGEGSWIGPVADGVGGAYASHKTEQKVRTTTR